MDLDFAFITCLLKDGSDGYRKAREKRVRPEFLQGPAIQAWDLIKTHEMKYGKLPTLDLLGNQMGIDIEKSNLEGVILEELIGDLETRYLHTQLTNSVGAAQEILNNYNPAEARALLRKALRELDEKGIGADESIVDISTLSGVVKDRYNKVKRGEIGIPSPWPSLDAVSLGWESGDLVVFVARTGIGKTWALLLCAEAAWEAGNKVLFITTEMSQTPIAMRFYSERFGLPYQDVRKAQLGAFQEEKFFKELAEFDGGGKFLLSGGNFTVDIDSIAMLVEKSRPDLLLIDGLYLIRNPYSKNTDRFTRVAENVEALQSLGKRKGIPIIASTQFNRKVSENKEDSVDISKIGLSDVIGWTTTFVIALIRTPKMRANRIMKLKTLKVREDTRVTLTLNWNFDCMDFSEREVELETEEVEAVVPKVESEFSPESSDKGSLVYKGPT